MLGIRIEGAGHIEAVAHDRDNAMLRYCWHRVSKDAGFDFKSWWRENAKKKLTPKKKEKIRIEDLSPEMKKEILLEIRRKEKRRKKGEPEVFQHFRQKSHSS